MPPFIPKRRLDETPPPGSTPPAKRAKLAATTNSKFKTKAKPKAVPPPSQPAVSDDDSDSSLSDIQSDTFEDVPAALKQPQEDDEEEDSDDEVDWEDAGAPETTAHAPLPTENISITINKEDDYIDYGASANKTAKKGPSKREKEVRMRTHQMHVQFLLYHNLLRNSWTCDKDVHKTLVDQLPSQIRKEVDKWRRASGLAEPAESKNTLTNSKKGRKGRSKNERDERDWGRPSSRLEPRAADMSRGDPLNSLLKVLSAYWKKRFAVTAPGLRKRGYSTKLELRRDIDSYRRGPQDPELHGEVVRNIHDFRAMAQNCEGSRDVGAQLFTALLRGLGIESRLVVSLQPSGYGWTKAEQMAPRKQTNAKPQADSTSSSEDEMVTSTSNPKSSNKKTPTMSARKKQPIREGGGQQDAPIDLDSDAGEIDSDSVSVIDVTPSLPKARRALYDRELAFPTYWTEAVSPITSKTIPCSPLVLENPVATTDEYLAAFEPRGAKAEAAKLVMAYVMGYSADNTAKDLTVRYLRKHIFPGKAKTFRFPVQSIPVYSSSGKIKRYEDYDWFKTVLSPYTRSSKLRTATDDLEDSTDLVPQEREKKKEEEGIDTLASLKSNPDFVLERHLRREEAVRPGAKPDRMFMSGKEPNIKSEPVYRRSDIERCLTAESWHKEGRRPKHGEVPMKLVPVRAVTLTRKREAEEHERVTGQKQLQGLYSWDQSEYIIPPPIENGIIPKNAYGNIDAFVPSMVPEGAVHIPLKGTVRICKRLEIDFAEAIVGFEFGNKRAVPVAKGVVVAKQNEKMVREAWKEYDEARRKKEETKMEKLVLDLWRKFVMGLRIRKEVGEAYGDRGETSSHVATRSKTGETHEEAIDVDKDEDMAGGFEHEMDQPAADEDCAGGFLLPEEEDKLQHEDLVVEELSGTQEKVKQLAGTEEELGSEGDEEAAMPVRSNKGKGKEEHYPTPMSMVPSKPKAGVRGKQKSLLSQGNSINDTGESGRDSASTASSVSAFEAAEEATSSIRNESSSSSSSTTSAFAGLSNSEPEPDDLPASTTRRRRRGLPNQAAYTPTQSQLIRSSARKTRSSAVEREPVPDSKTQALSSSKEGAAKQAIVATPTKQSRRRGRPRKTVTSPYFDESDND